MELILKVLIIAVVIVAVIAIVRLMVQTSSQSVTRAQAVANVTKFIEENWTNSVVNITSVTPSQYQGSWDILAGVITNNTSPCPSYFVLSFEYPFNTYNYRVQNNYVVVSNPPSPTNCKVNEATIGSAPVAIAKSYSLNTSVVNDFVNQYGYPQVTVQANRVNAQLNGQNYSGIWAVYYNAPGANRSVQVYLGTNGTLITAT